MLAGLVSAQRCQRDAPDPLLSFTQLVGRDPSTLRQHQIGDDKRTPDLETGAPVPFGGRTFDGVVVTNYLHRPVLPAVVAAVGAGGVLLYETFAVGHERFGRPRNPDFLLRPGELLDAVRGALRVVAYEDLVLDDPEPRAVQRIAAVRAWGPGGR